MQYRSATAADADRLAPLNAELIRDEGHRNTMSVSELANRMRGWLNAEYRAVLFEESQELVGYALYRLEPEHVYLRQFLVQSAFRRRGVGREAIAWLRRNAWGADARVRVDVLVGNVAGQAFWRNVGFHDYCVTLEQEPSSAA